MHMLHWRMAAKLQLMYDTQSISQAKIRQWFTTAKQSRTIICAHCTCMAGLGEDCSHISHSAPAAETHTCLVKNTACTSLPCGWLPPTLKNVTVSAMSSDNGPRLFSSEPLPYFGL